MLVYSKISTCYLTIYLRGVPMKKKITIIFLLVLGVLAGCDAAINYYTGFTINRVNSVAEKPDYIIEEIHNAQKSTNILKQISEAGYKEIKEIDFRGLVLAKIYQKP